MRINITVELTEDFKNFLITHGQRAAWVWVAGVLSALLVGFILVFPSAGATLICLLLVALFGYGLSVLYTPATFTDTERESLYNKIEQLQRGCEMRDAHREHDGLVFQMAMRAKDEESQAALVEAAKLAEVAAFAPYAMAAAEAEINPTFDEMLGLNPATAHLAAPAPKPKRVRKPTPSQARKLREAAANG